MFRDTKAFSGFSVNDIEQAAHFYGELLQIKVVKNQMMPLLELHVAGSTPIFVYEKSDHIPATYTMLNFQVSDIINTIKALKVKGVTMEQYHFPQFKTDENGIFHDKNMHMRIAWFKDPAGNILSIIEDNATIA